jgi:uncharacterized protein (DUF58 family)
LSLKVNFLFKPIYASYHRSSGLWYWARRRLTPAGWAVGIALVITASVGTDIENTVTYKLFALLLALAVFALASVYSFRARFSATRILPRVGTAGRPLFYKIVVKNLTVKNQPGLMVLEDLADPRPTFEEWLAYQKAEDRRVGRAFGISRRQRSLRNPFRVAKVKSAALPVLPARGVVEADGEVFPLRRGILKFKGVTVARPDPFGLFRAFIPVPAPQTVLILPRRYPLPDIALPGALRYQEGGVALAAHVGASEEFVALREYRHGDPMRHIHWRSWAKTGKPIVKEFEDEFFVRHALVLDTFDDEPNSEVLEEAVSVAASFACTMLTQESLLDLLFVGNQSYCFTAGRGLAHADQMLEILASVKNCADKPFSVLESLVLNHITVVSGCICVFQKWDGPRKKFVEKLKALGVPLLILIVVPAGGGFSGAGGDLVDAEGSVHVLEIGKIEETLARLK